MPFGLIESREKNSPAVRVDAALARAGLGGKVFKITRPPLVSQGALLRFDYMRVRAAWAKAPTPLLSSPRVSRWTGTRSLVETRFQGLAGWKPVGLGDFSCSAFRALCLFRFRHVDASERRSANRVRGARAFRNAANQALCLSLPHAMMMHFDTTTLFWLIRSFGFVIYVQYVIGFIACDKLHCAGYIFERGCRSVRLNGICRFWQRNDGNRRFEARIRNRSIRGVCGHVWVCCSVALRGSSCTLHALRTALPDFIGFFNNILYLFLPFLCTF